MPVSQRTYGITASGETVTEFTLTNRHGYEARILDYGCTLTHFFVPTARGKMCIRDTYNPLGAMAGSLFFGFFDSLQTVFQSVLPSQLVMMAPYLFTLIVIVFGVKRGKAPAGIGKHVEN